MAVVIRHLPLSILLRCLTLFLFGLGGFVARAEEDRLMENIEYVSVNNHAAIKINFSDLISYTRHFPAARGNTLEVHLRLRNDGVEPVDHADREVLLAPISKAIPLIGVTQESSDNDNPVLVIRFSQAVDFDVKVAQDSRGLLINLPNIPFSDSPSGLAAPKRLLTLSDIDPTPELTDVDPAIAINKAAKLMEDGRAALNSGDRIKAQNLFSAVLNMPDHPFRDEAEQLLKASKTKAASQPDRAPRAAKNTVPKLAEDPQVLLEQGKAAIRSEDYPAAEAILSKLLQTPGHELTAEAERFLAIAREGAMLSSVESGDATSAKPASETPPPAAIGSGLPETIDSLPDGSASEKLPSPPVININSNDPAELMEIGSNALRENHIEEAVRIFTRVLELPPHPFTAEAERLLLVAKNAFKQNKAADLRDPVIGDPETLDDVIRLMDQGRLALTEEDNNRAIVIFDKIISLPEHPHLQEARELLGLARQRNGQLAQAKIVYEDYLKIYKDGADADRVRQRLADMVNAESKPRRQLAGGGKATADTKFKIDSFGSIAQTYNFGVREVVEIVEGDSKLPEQQVRKTVREEDQSVLISFITANNRSRNDRFDIRSALSSTHQKNFLKEDNKDRLLINQMYVDFKDRSYGYSAKLGRQSGSTAGTLGRFDGLLAGVDILPKLRVNGAVGFPVDLSNKDSIDFDTVFVAGNVQFKDVLPNIDIIPYGSYQSVEAGITDRAAIGEEVRFFHPKGNLFQLLDYDVIYNALNVFFVQGQWNLLESTSLYSSFDYRASPLLTTRNALINRTGVTTLTQLLETVSEAEVRASAKKQTGSALAAVFGANYMFSEKIQVSGDFNWASQTYSDGTLESSPTLKATEDAYTYTARLTTSGIVADAEITIFAFAFADAATSNDTSFTVQNRAPFGEGWRIDSELRLNWRSDTTGQNLARLRPALKLVYDWKRLLNLEAEIGTEISTYSGNTTNEDGARIFGSLGYRLTF